MSVIDIFSLGDLFTVKSHPFFADGSVEGISENAVLIGANPIFTPPVMVVSEILYEKSKNETPTTIRQIKGIFYSHRNHKFHENWFEIFEVKKINNEKIKKKYVQPILNGKSSFVGRQVSLPNIDIELSKEKINTEKNYFNYSTIKKNPYLDFIPPVMEIIGEESTYEKSKNKSNINNRQVSISLLKCKYFNPHFSNYSIILIPLECLIDITDNFNNHKFTSIIGSYIMSRLNLPIAFEDLAKNQANTILYIKEIVFNHYEYILKAIDIFTQQSIDLPVYNSDNSAPKSLSIEDIFDKKKPSINSAYSIKDSDFLLNQIYEIEYVSSSGKTSKRVILIRKKEKIKDGDLLIIANCFLREGKIRHFLMKNIKRYCKLKKEYIEILLTKSPV